MNSRRDFARANVFAIAVVAFLTGSAAGAETVYVTDMLQLELYATAEVNGRPIRKLRSGDRMEVLERRARIAQVRLDDGQIGWVKSLYIVDQEPARTRMNQLEKENASLQSIVDKLRAQLEGQQARVAELEGTKSGAAERRAAEARELAQLRTDNAALQASLASYDSSVPLNWFLAGLLLCLCAGGAAGWYWVDSRSRAKHGGYRVY